MYDKSDFISAGHILTGITVTQKEIQHIFYDPDPLFPQSKSLIVPKGILCRFLGINTFWVRIADNFQRFC